MTKKSMRNENDSILSNNEYPEINISLESSKSPLPTGLRKNDSPFLQISDLGDSNLFS
jgi:hypothetical protein